MTKKEVEIQITDEEIQYMSKWSFRKYLKEKTNCAAFSFLVKENNKREKTRHVKFLDLKMSEYLKENRRTSLFTFIFSIRSKTPWRYTDLLCVKCQLNPKTIEHFSNCDAYGNMLEMNGTDIFGNDIEKQTKS